jgi:uncharacterized protein (TIGR02268 family)
MSNLQGRALLLLLLMSSVAAAKEPESVERDIYLSPDPTYAAQSVYVAYRLVTVLRFEREVDPARTKMLGWEGRFEPLLVGGKKVVLEPLQSLEPRDRFLLLVTLADGTEIRFSVTARTQTFEGRRNADLHVNVFFDRKGYDSMVSSLNLSLQRERELREKVDRYEQEENSVDHAFATLLANGAVKQTPFVQDHKWKLKDADVEMLVTVYSGKGKAAVVFQIANQSTDTPWQLTEARLSTATTGMARSFALRMNQPSIAPGSSGTLAVVADQSSFSSAKGVEDLALELFRQDGLQQALVVLDHRLAHE